MSTSQPLAPGDVVWVDFSPTVGREQRGRRPAVVISTVDYLRAIPELVVIVPVTTADRGWVHHVRLSGDDLTLTETSFAMTEQPRAVSRRRIVDEAGSVSKQTLAVIRRWISDFTVME